jgi:hypothetical protein
MTIPIRDFEVTIEFIPVEQRDENLIREFVKKQTEIFANAPYNQYVMHESNLNRFVSTKELLGTEMYQSFDQLYSHKHEAGYIYCDDLQTAIEINSEKFSIPQSTLVIIRKTLTNEILGGIFTYKARLEKAFRNYEEWENPLLYSGINIESKVNDYDQFKTLLQQELPDYNFENHDVMILNSVFLSPELRNYYSLIFQLNLYSLEHMPEEHIPVILEMIENSTINKMFVPLELKKIDFALDDSGKFLYYHKDFAKCRNTFTSLYSRFSEKRQAKTKLVAELV